MSTIVLGCDDNDSKNAEWQNTVAKALENAAAVNNCRFLQLSGNRTHKAADDKDGHWKAQGDLGNNDSPSGVEQVQALESRKQRNDQSVNWHHHAHQKQGVDGLGQLPIHTGDGVGSHGRQNRGHNNY